MKTLLKAVVLAFLSMTAGVVMAHMAFAAEKDFGYVRVAGKCPGGMATQDEFFATVEKMKIEVWALTASGQKKAIATYNGAASRNGTQLLADDAKFYFGRTKSGTGIVIMHNSCVVPGSVVEIPSAHFAEFLLRAGVTAEEMTKFVIGTDA